MCCHAAWGTSRPPATRVYHCHIAEFAVLGGSVLGDQDAVADVVDGEVGDGVAARFVE